MTDMVNHPPHYTHGPIECVRAIHAALGNRGFLSYLRGTIIKYSWRAEHKGATMQDMAKIGFYSNEAVVVAGALELEDSETKKQTAEPRAMRDALKHAAEQAQKDHAEIERLERELGRFQGEITDAECAKVGPWIEAIRRAANLGDGLSRAEVLRLTAISLYKVRPEINPNAQQVKDTIMRAERESVLADILATEPGTLVAFKTHPGPDHPDAHTFHGLSKMVWDEDKLRAATTQAKLPERGTPANAVGEAMQALDRAVEATRGITFAPDGETARQIVDCQNLTQALICRIGRI
jgi:hypothetical protein